MSQPSDLTGPQVKLLRKLSRIKRVWYSPEPHEWQSAQALIDKSLAHVHFKNARKVRITERGSRENLRRLDALADLVRSTSNPSQEEIDAWIKETS